MVYVISLFILALFNIVLGLYLIVRAKGDYTFLIGCLFIIGAGITLLSIKQITIEIIIFIFASFQIVILFLFVIFLEKQFYPKSAEKGGISNE